MLDRLEIKNGAQDTNFQLCRLHIDLFHDDFWSGINNGLFLKKIKIMRGRPQGIVEALMYYQSIPLAENPRKLVEKSKFLIFCTF